MIEKLRKSDIPLAAKVYRKGLSMEIPKGDCKLSKSIDVITNETECYVYKKENKIYGLLSFYHKTKNKIAIDFICALKSRLGIGTNLMRMLAKYCIKHNIKYIYSNVSSRDDRVIKFYEACGFRKYSYYYATKKFLLYRVKAKPQDILN